MKINAIRIAQQGGVEQMRLESIELAPPKPGEVRVRHEVDRRQLHRHVPSLRSVQIADAERHRRGSGRRRRRTRRRRHDARDAAIASAIAADRSARTAEAANVPAARLIKLPDGVSCDAAAAMLLKGLTVQYLFRQTYKLSRGETILFHAAAGGVGLIACQWARHLGVTMIGTVSSAEKAKLATARGCDHIIDYTTEDVAARVVALTGGKKVPVVYDGVGKDTFIGSLDSLAPRGLLVSFGNSSGAGHRCRPRHSVGERFAVRHAPHARDVHRDARDAAVPRQRAVRPRRERRHHAGHHAPLQTR